MGASSARRQARRDKFGISHSSARLDSVESKEVMESRQALAMEEFSAEKIKKSRFIVFVGNLPYTATDSSISKHFAKLKPNIRHRVDKVTGKSKGFAFLEFERFDRMKTCLKLHHSVFNDGESPDRKINVELTVGGGGAKSKDRRAKLKAKNEKLRLEQTKPAATKERNVSAQDEERPAEDANIHPSRASRVPRQ